MDNVIDNRYCLNKTCSVRIDRPPGITGRKFLKTSKNWLHVFFIKLHNQQDLLRTNIWICIKCYRKLLKDHNQRKLFNIVYGGDPTYLLSQSLYDLNFLSSESIVETTVNTDRLILTSETSVFLKFDDLRVETVTGNFTQYQTKKNYYSLIKGITRPQFEDLYRFISPFYDETTCGVCLYDGLGIYLIKMKLGLHMSYFWFFLSKPLKNLIYTF